MAKHKLMRGFDRGGKEGGGTGRYREVQGGRRIIKGLGRVRTLGLLGFSFILSVLLVLGINYPATATPRHYTELEFPTLPEVKLPDYISYKLPNGLLVYLVEDHEFPVINGRALVKVGSRWEPANQVGLASLTGTVMRTGGTQQRTGDELDQSLEQIAANIELFISRDSGNAYFKSLTKDVDQVFGLFAETLTQPVFDQEKIEVAKIQVQGHIARRNDSPGRIAYREVNKLIYGADSPYARSTEYANLDAIDRDTMIKFYQQYFHPNNMILGISGDFDPQQMQKLISEKLGSWQPNSQLQLPPLPKVDQATTGGLFFIQQPQLTQSFVQLGHLGGMMKDADYGTLDVINNLLNGFGGRLFDEVRSRQGLAYSVYGFWSPNYDYPGVFMAGGQTKSETTVPLIKGILGEIDRLRTTPMNEAELNLAKDATLNSFVFNFQTPGYTLSRLIDYAYYDYPQDFIFQYQRQVAATTIADVQRAAKTYLQPEKLVILVVGNKAAIQPPLTTLNSEVKEINIAIPNATIPAS